VDGRRPDRTANENRKSDDYHLVVLIAGRTNLAEVADLGAPMEIHRILWSTDSRQFVVSGMGPDHRDRIIVVSREP